ncbi:hypothetical protein QTO34_003632 [Cnephaeus nilssonii]|uniref:Clathrin/coatomer adaptor adaptin-like N-terminal domain-containing protein n=1 Tax=Cnephaeus nilssonii TaxID=3371016 RepID=A0AA40LLH7_CNENI|nr:hypothetical protein QTO34_003632 [Eptesicus nilssonii]
MDSKYFTTNKKGEIFELKAKLSNEKRKGPGKKVIAAMTVGEDVSSLFPDRAKCVQTEDLELKKLVYLYWMNHANNQPDMAIMAVNSFAKDCDYPNPRILALAVSTMECIQVDKMTEYLPETLPKCLKDEDPMFGKQQQSAWQNYMISMPKWWKIDSNPMVVANAVAVLSEISDSHLNSNLLDLNPQNVNKLLTSLNESDYYNMLLKKLALPCHLSLCCLGSQRCTNIAQVLAELKECVTEVDADCWAIGQCTIDTGRTCNRNRTTVVYSVRQLWTRLVSSFTIKVEQSTECHVSTLLDLIQTKVNYVVQEVTVVIRDISTSTPTSVKASWPLCMRT